MSLTQIAIPAPKPKKKGGFLGGLGAVGGLVSTAVSLVPGGGTASKIIGLGSDAASTAGGLSGEGGVSVPGATQGIEPVSAAAKSKLAQDPRAQVAALNESLSALKNADPRFKQSIEPFLISARERAMGRIG